MSCRHDDEVHRALVAGGPGVNEPVDGLDHAGCQRHRRVCVGGQIGSPVIAGYLFQNMVGPVKQDKL